MLETDRLLLRPWQEGDAEKLYPLAKDPAVGPAAGWLPHTGVEDSRAVIRNVLSAEGTFAVTLKDTGALAGCAGWMETTAHKDLHELELGYWMGRAFWGRGYAPEAVEALLRHCFEVLAQPRVWCAHYEGNEKSRRVIEKCGFRPMFSREEDVNLFHERRMACYYAITEDEWRARL